MFYLKEKEHLLFVLFLLASYIGRFLQSSDKRFHADKMCFVNTSNGVLSGVIE